MIPVIKKILYATDLSDGASHAFGYAIRLAISNDAKISIINVCEKFTNQTNIQLRSEDQETAKARLTENIKAKLNKYKEMEKIEGGCPFSKLVDKIYITSGMPVPSIIEHAASGKYDLIVMGTHGHGFLYSALIGSNAQKMVQQSKIPVMVVRLPEKIKEEAGP